MNQYRREQLDNVVATLPPQRLTRRAFLHRSMQLAIATPFLSQVFTRASHAMAAPAVAPATLEQIKKEGGKLFVYAWEDAIHPNTIPRFEQEFGVKVTYDTFAGNAQLLAKIQAGGAAYDIIWPTHNFVPVYIAQGLLAPLNHANIPNMQLLLPTFRQHAFDPGNVYSMPYDWGMTGMAYNATAVRDDPHMGSWALLFDSGPQRYSGKLGLTDEREEVMAAALQYLGHNPNTHDRQALRQAGDLLMRLKPHIKAFYPGAEVKKALITEDLVVAQSWNGEAVKAHTRHAAVTWSLPKEGGTGWFDTMAIPKAAPHKFTAAVFINYSFRPEVSAENANVTGYATCNQAALEKHLAPEVAKNPAIYPPDEAMQRITFLAAIPDDLLQVYDDIWTRLLAS